MGNSDIGDFLDSIGTTNSESGSAASSATSAAGTGSSSGSAASGDATSAAGTGTGERRGRGRPSTKQAPAGTGSDAAAKSSVFSEATQGTLGISETAPPKRQRKPAPSKPDAALGMDAASGLSFAICMTIQMGGQMLIGDEGSFKPIEKTLIEANLPVALARLPARQAETAMTALPLLSCAIGALMYAVRIGQTVAARHQAEQAEKATVPTWDQPADQTGDQAEYQNVTPIEALRSNVRGV